MSNGKGDTPRPIADRAQYEANWERTFGVSNVPSLANITPDLIAAINADTLRKLTAEAQCAGLYAPEAYCDHAAGLICHRCAD